MGWAMDMLNPILVYLLYIVYTRHILFILSMYFVYPWNIFLRNFLTLSIPVLRLLPTPLRYLDPEKIALVYPWCSPHLENG